jgi:hypothetical protein
MLSVPDHLAQVAVALKVGTLRRGLSQKKEMLANKTVWLSASMTKGETVYLLLSGL